MFVFFTVISGIASIYGTYTSLSQSNQNEVIQTSNQELKQYISEIITEFKVSLDINVPYMPDNFPNSKDTLENRFTKELHSHLESKNYNSYSIVSNDDSLYSQLKSDLVKFFNFGVLVYKDQTVHVSCVNARIDPQKCRPDLSFPFSDVKNARAVTFSTSIQDGKKFVRISVYELPIIKFSKGRKIRVLSDFENTRLFITYPTGMFVTPYEQEFLNYWRIDEMYFHLGNSLNLQVVGKKEISANAFQGPLPWDNWVGLTIRYEDLQKLSDYKIRVDQYDLPDRLTGFNNLLNNYDEPW